MEVLPLELWDLILSFLNRPRDVEAAVGVCHDFRAIITASSRLHNLLTLPRFDEQASRDVTLDQDGRHARFEADNAPMDHKRQKKWALPIQSFTGLFLSSMKRTQVVAHYPVVHHNTAYVQQQRGTLDASPVTAVAHFRIESEPSEYFCISVACEAPRGRPPRPADTFAASLFADGDVHTYGALVKVEDADRKAAQFTKGDIISVQIGTYPAHVLRTPHAPGWSEMILLDRGRSGAGFSDPFPYVIFYKNYAIVHHPMALRIGVTFTRTGEHPGQTAITFQPLLPSAAYPPPARATVSKE